MKSDDDLTGAGLQAYKWGREGIPDGLPWEESSSTNIKGQMDKEDADASDQEKEDELEDIDSENDDTED